MQKYKILATGRVQGVGFRYFTLMIAQDLGIKGQVWNNPDSTVGILAQIPDSTSLAEFEKRLRNGSRWIRIDYLNAETANFPDFSEFKISSSERIL